MKDWIETARTEPEEVEELNVEFLKRLFCTANSLLRTPNGSCDIPSSQRL